MNGNGRRGWPGAGLGARLGLVLAAMATMVAMLSPAWSQGFAGLGATADGSAVPQRGTRLNFPRDHAAHPAFRIEWWYLTANMTDAQGRDMGLQWTLFRQAMAPDASGVTPGAVPDAAPADWSRPQVWMGHAAVTTAQTHVLSEVFARGGIGQAGVRLDPFSVWIDDWQMTAAPPAEARRAEATGPEAGPAEATAAAAPAAPPPADPLNHLRLTASGDDFSYDVRLTARGPLVPHGDRGYSVKSPQGQASYYYSQPFFDLTGSVTLGGDTHSVSGTAWLDREWSSQPLAADQTGWDWVSLHLPGGAKLMAFRLRDSGPGFTSGTYIAPDGTPSSVEDGRITLTPLEITDVAGAPTPTSWHLSFPDRGLDLTLSAINPFAAMTTRFPYWEGPVRFSGSHAGMGYLEMTGY